MDSLGRGNSSQNGWQSREETNGRIDYSPAVASELESDGGRSPIRASLKLARCVVPFLRLPLMLAWCCTIPKNRSYEHTVPQGKQLESAPTMRPVSTHLPADIQLDLVHKICTNTYGTQADSTSGSGINHITHRKKSVKQIRVEGLSSDEKLTPRQMYEYAFMRSRRRNGHPPAGQAPARSETPADPDFEPFPLNFRGEMGVEEVSIETARLPDSHRESSSEASEHPTAPHWRV
ncbi:hypothetical protein KEM48_006208 [Puccinia striiformis f. sp. tritici PST-130]|nr:hypothetical protein KEM48_006208 [Puccinia striiformis f. sp. tritici PST-130]